MKYNTYPQFVSAVDSSSIQLHPLLRDDCPSVISPICYQPDAWHGALATAGRLLSHDSQRALSSQPLPDSLHPTDSTQDALYTVINDSIARQQTADPDYSFSAAKAYKIDACGFVESSFGMTFRAMRHPEKTYYYKNRKDKPIGWQIVHNDQEPIAVTKVVGVHSSLSLVPLTIGGIRYPAGSLLTLGSFMPPAPYGERDKFAVPKATVTDAGFVRLSLFAHPSRLRQAGQPFEQWWHMRFQTLDKIRALASRAMSASIHVDTTT